MTGRRTERFTTADAPQALLAEIRALMHDAFDGDFDDDDWEHGLGGTHVIARSDRAVVAHASVVERTIEVAGRPYRAGYVESVGTAPPAQGEGHGSAVMAEAATIIRGDFELGVLATGEHGFYGRLGWERWRGPTAVRHGDRLVPSPDADDAIMILRTAASADIDVTAHIACSARSGDDW